MLALRNLGYLALELVAEAVELHLQTADFQPVLAGFSLYTAVVGAGSVGRADVGVSAAHVVQSQGLNVDLTHAVGVVRSWVKHRSRGYL